MNDKGNIAVMAALAMPIVLGGAGVGVETGYWYYEQLRLQQAADAAAYAAALAHREGEAETMLASATAVAQMNSYEPGKDTLDLVNPSLKAPADEHSVEVEMTRRIPRAFTAIFSSDPIHIRVTSAASYQPASDACLIALDTSAPKGIEFQGSSMVDVSGCVIASNSLSDTAVYSQGASSVTAPCLVAVGGVSIQGNATMTQCEAPLENQLPIADPFRDVEIPSPGPCAHGNYQPGKTYCGSQKINKDTTFDPGVYIFSGGEVKVNGGAALIGSGVTLIFVDGAYLQFNGNADIQLSAPTSGPYAGIVMMGSRTSSGHDIVLNGTATSHLTGALYFPSDPVRYTGNFSGEDGCIQVVAKTIQWNGNASVSVDCSAHGMEALKIGGRPYLLG
ncbi:MAG TPA: pilus assembly protein TadG-related protein [Caulobacteraceae bacterium]|nr:pilus assembly protein TadG-related protein [Caulobacteraceae bacterium]